MHRSTTRWALRATLTVVVVVTAARLLKGRPPGSESGAIPAIGGDTWPPVPVNPDRKD